MEAYSRTKERERWSSNCSLFKGVNCTRESSSWRDVPSENLVRICFNRTVTRAEVFD